MSQGCGSGAVDEAVEVLLLGALGAAEDATIGLHAGGDDPAAALSTGRCDRGWRIRSPSERPDYRHRDTSVPADRIYSGVRRRRIPEAKTSRMLTTPVRLRPSKTGRWRNPFVNIRWAASSAVVSGVAVTGSLVIH
jgi:hypothetical protein